MNIVALIPTLHRPDGLLRVLNSLRETAPDVNIVVACDPDDEQAARTAELFGATVAVCKEARRGCAYAWNTALAAATDADIYILGADDAIFTPGWLEEALGGLARIGGSGLIGFNAKWKPSETSYHYMMTRDFMIEHHGGVAAVPHYFTWGVDTEACKRAKRAGKYLKVRKAVVLHDWRGPDGDETYQMGAARQEETKEIYYKRLHLNFPDDFKPIIGRKQE